MYHVQVHSKSSIVYMYNKAIVEACVSCTCSNPARTVLNCYVVQQLIALHQRGLMALQRYCEWYYKKTEDTAKIGTVAVLVHWPRENVNTFILTQRATPILCVQQFTAKKLKLPTLFSLPYFGDKSR